MDNRTKFFDDYQSALTFFDNLPSANWANNNAYWRGGDYPGSLQKAKRGDVALAQSAQDIIDQISDVLLPSIEVYQDTPHYYGSRPNISAVVAGTPKSMYRRQYVEAPANRGPIRLFLDRAVSAAFSPDEVLKRGVAILALVMALKRFRPVSLYVGECTQSTERDLYRTWGIAVDLNNIDFSVLAYVVAGVSFYRCLGMSIDKYLDYGNTSGYVQSAHKIKELLDWSDHDVIFDGLSILDADASLAIDNPIQWVKDKLVAISNRGAAAE
jgi:hypothetical protein